MRIKLVIPIHSPKSRLYEGSMFTVGRVEGNDIVIPESAVSSRHGRFVVRNETLLFEDLNSRNGSLVERELEASHYTEQPMSSKWVTSCFWETCKIQFEFK